MKIRRNAKDYKIKPCKNGKITHSNTCQFCGEAFLSNRTTAKYCSDTCKQHAYFYRHNK